MIVTIDQLKTWLTSEFELSDAIAVRPLALRFWEESLENYESQPEVFVGKVYAMVCYASPHLDKYIDFGKVNESITRV